MLLSNRMSRVAIGVTLLLGAVSALGLAATLPNQTIPGATHGVPQLIGEVTIRNAAGQESYVFRQGERIRFELTVRNLENRPVKVVYASGATHSFLVVAENLEAVVGDPFCRLESEARRYQREAVGSSEARYLSGDCRVLRLFVRGP
jgi:hypothetical protein